MHTGKYCRCTSLISIMNNRPEFKPWQRQRFFFSLRESDQLWIPPSLLSSRYHGSFPQGYTSRGHRIDHSSPFRAKFKNVRSYASLSSYIYMAWHLIKHKVKLTFYNCQFSAKIESKFATLLTKNRIHWKWQIGCWCLWCISITWRLHRSWKHLIHSTKNTARSTINSWLSKVTMFTSERGSKHKWCLGTRSGNITHSLKV